MTVVVIISANIEWNAVRRMFPEAAPQESPYGQWFETHLDIKDDRQSVVFVHGGWGKISAAASAQYAIDRWSPNLVVNLGTCGGFEGEVEKYAVMLVERTPDYSPRKHKMSKRARHVESDQRVTGYPQKTAETRPG